MNTLNKHWDLIFSSKNNPELGWYEADVTQTLKFLEKVPKLSDCTIFLAGAGTSVLIDELILRGGNLILNDLSEVALNKLKQRIGIDHPQNYWLHHNIAHALPPNIPNCDIWIDRAVLHFLLDENEINGYFNNLHSLVKSGGYVLLAEFSLNGASKCAGLNLHRYSLDEMTQRIGVDFELVEHENYTFINPYGEPRPYIYALFRRK